MGKLVKLKWTTKEIPALEEHLRSDAEPFCWQRLGMLPGKRWASLFLTPFSSYRICSPCLRSTTAWRMQCYSKGTEFCREGQLLSSKCTCSLHFLSLLSSYLSQAPRAAIRVPLLHKGELYSNVLGCINTVCEVLALPFRRVSVLLLLFFYVQL